MTEVLSKGDKVLNPKTNRYVSVGSSSWKKLVLEGVLSGAYKEVHSSKPLKKTTPPVNSPESDEKVVLVSKPKVKKSVVEPVEPIVEEDDEDNLEELDKQLGELLKKSEPKTTKKCGRPRKPKFETKVIETKDDDDSLDDEETF